MKRRLSTIAIALVALVIIALIIVDVSLGRIVKKGVEFYGPKMTQTTVDVDTVTLSLFTGSASVKGLVVGNPSGYKSPSALAVGTIAVGINPTTVFANKIVIRSIRLESPDITFEGGLAGNNLSQILDNVNSTGKSSGTLSTNVAAQPKSEKKYEVDDLVITGAKVRVILIGVKAGEMTLPLPEIHLTDLGKGGDGITATDLTRRILGAITSTSLQAVAKTATGLGENAKTLRQAGQNAGKQLGNAVKSLLGK